MKAQDLKNSILQLAIQGKLVEQREEEGTAKELIEQIEAEKEKLINEGKIKKQKVLPKITEDEIPFDIPESWEWVRINDLADSCDVPFADGPFGSNLKSEHYILEPEVRIIQLSNIGEDGWRNENVKYTSLRHLETIKRSKVNAGEIVIAKMMPAGRAIEVPNVDLNYVLSSDAVKFVPHPFLNKRYLLNAINSGMFRSQIYAEVQGITRVRTSLTKLKTYLIPIPPLEEQKRIVAKIEELLPYVDQYDKAYTEVEELNKKFPEDMQKSILQYAIQGKLVEQREEDGTAEELYQIIQAEKEKLIKEGKIKKTKPLPEITEDEIPFDIPENWKWVRLADVSHNIHYGYTSSAKEKGNCKLLRITDIQNNRVEWNDVPFCDVKDKEFKAYGLNNRDIMIARTGGTIGKTYIVDSLNDKAVFASYLIRVIPVNNINEGFLKKFMESPLYWLQLKAGSMGTGQPNVNSTTLGKLLLPLPPLQEQKRIVEKIEELLPYTKQLVKKLD